MNDSILARHAFNGERILVLSSALADAPAPPKKLTLKEALAVLAPELKAAQVRGHTVGSLTAVLNAQGMSASVRAVSQALRAASPKPSRVKRTKTSAMENQSPT